MKKVEELFHAGLAALEEGKLDAAITAFSKVISLCDNHEVLAQTYGFRAAAYKRKNEDDKAINDLKTAADYGNEVSLKLLIENVGINYTPKKQSPAPLSSTPASPKPAQKPEPIIVVKSSSSENYQCYYELSVFDMMKNDLNGAIANISKAITLVKTDNEFSGGHLVRGNYYQMKGDKNNAIDDFKISADYGNADALEKLKKDFGISYTPQRHIHKIIVPEF